MTIKVLSVLTLFSLLGAGCITSLSSNNVQEPQFGVNFMRYFVNNATGNTNEVNPLLYPSVIIPDLQALGAEEQRAMTKADLMWDVVEPTKGNWDFSKSDQVIGKGGIAPMITLFRQQFASPTPPWAKEGEFEPAMNADAEEYLTTVVDRYASVVKYWEIGNEMNHWQALELSQPLTEETKEQLPVALPDHGYSLEDQGKFIAAASKIIRAHDPDAIVILPGMIGTNDYTVYTWLPQVVKAAGADSFDVVDVHDYKSWQDLIKNRAKVRAEMAVLKLDKPIWMNETGSTSDPTLTLRTNYPNSETSQAADVFRRTIPSFADGVEHLNWHSYYNDAPDNNNWRGYGLIDENGKKPAYWSYQLLAHELIPFKSMTAISTDSNQYIYKIETTNGDTRYVAWGTGTFSAPATGRYTSVIPETDGTFSWQDISSGSTITLSDLPVLLEVTP